MANLCERVPWKTKAGNAIGCWTIIYVVGFRSPELCDQEAERVERNDV
jgi:hypothetical protein